MSKLQKNSCYGAYGKLPEPIDIEKLKKEFNVETIEELGQKLFDSAELIQRRTNRGTPIIDPVWSKEE